MLLLIHKDWLIENLLLFIDAKKKSNVSIGLFQKYFGRMNFKWHNFANSFQKKTII